MRKVLGILAIAVLACGLPSPAEAQCNDACVRFVKSDGGTAGYGCVESTGSGQNCIATTTRCSLQTCMYAVRFTTEGAFAGVRDGCAAEAAASARVAARGVGRQVRSGAFSVSRELLGRRARLGLTRGGLVRSD